MDDITLSVDRCGLGCFGRGSSAERQAALKDPSKPSPCCYHTVKSSILLMYGSLGKDFGNSMIFGLIQVHCPQNSKHVILDLQIKNGRYLKYEEVHRRR